MLIGGVYLTPGTVLDIAARDYLNGRNRLRLLVDTIVELQRGWLVLDGREKVPTGGYIEHRIKLNVAAVKRSQFPA